MDIMSQDYELLTSGRWRLPFVLSSFNSLSNKLQFPAQVSRLFIFLFILKIHVWRHSGLQCW